MHEFVEKLEKIFKGKIEYSPEILEKYSRDASLFKIKPQVVIFPANVEDVKNTVKLVNEANKNGSKIYITARSAGTDMTGGPLGESVIMDFTKYFNHIHEVTPEYAVTEPGVYYRDFEKATLEKGALLPCFPASRELCTVGGMTANNSGGEKTLLYGKTLDYVLELKAILRDGNEYTFKPIPFGELKKKIKQKDIEGEVYKAVSKLIDENFEKIKAAKPHVSKNSAGYYLWDVINEEKETFDMTKLLVGSQGTLGLITEVKFRLIKPHTHSRLLVVFLKKMDKLGTITNHILDHKPESLESYDDHTFKLAVRLFPLLLKRMKGGFIMLGLRFLPEFWSVLTGGIPKLVLMAEFTGDSEEEVTKHALAAQENLKKLGLKTKLASSPGDIGKYWTIRRESFRMLREHTKHMRTAPFIDDFVVNPEFLPEFLPKLYAILDQYKITYTIAGHVGNGNFHIIPLMDFTSPKTKEIIDELTGRVNDLVLTYKGSITGEHNDGVIRTPFIDKMFGHEIYKLFQDTKNIFDPDNMFNPGKKVGGTWEYALNHLDSQ